jgi:hypothetical protein
MIQIKKICEEVITSLDSVAHTYNLSFLGGRDRRIIEAGLEQKVNETLSQRTRQVWQETDVG